MPLVFFTNNKKIRIVTKSHMTLFLSLQSTYYGIELALLRDAHCMGVIHDDKRKASKNIIALLGELLKSYHVSLYDVAFLGVNQGPGPFTTLRVVIASVNGLSFATKKPLIGVDGLELLLQDYADHTYPISIAIMNAFAQDLYFSLNHHITGIREKGCKNSTALFLELKQRFPEQQLYFIGNGVQLYDTEITKIFGDDAIFAQPLPEHCSVQSVGRASLHYWQQQKNITYQLTPLYLKNQFLLA
jgi:tRNA threonylcarbamoyladenosine biosynthesis protein TsaB